MKTLPHGFKIGDVEIVELLSHNESGISYLGDKNGQKVVVKEVFVDGANRDADGKVVGSLQLSAKLNRVKADAIDLGLLLKDFSHQSIATMLDIVEQNNTVYLVREFVEGQVLSEISPGEIDSRNLFGKLLQALFYAQNRGVYNLSISMENIVVCNDETIKLLDVKLASSVDPEVDYAFMLSALLLAFFTGTRPLTLQEVKNGDDVKIRAMKGFALQDKRIKTAIEMGLLASAKRRMGLIDLANTIDIVLDHTLITQSLNQNHEFGDPALIVKFVPTASPLDKKIIYNILNDMVLVKGTRSFKLGSDDSDSSAADDEKPAKIIRMNTFFMSKFLVTQALYADVLGKNPTERKGRNLPVEIKSFVDADEFLIILNSKLDPACTFRFSLPTEAQYEYAAEGGQSSESYKYPGGDCLTEVAWYAANSENRSHDVGQKKPNSLGICDLAGNVKELCVDYYNRNTYSLYTEGAKAPSVPGEAKVTRGGNFQSRGFACRSKSRTPVDSDKVAISHIGFRLVVNYKDVKKAK